jgi:hypothetical protein
VSASPQLHIASFACVAISAGKVLTVTSCYAACTPQNNTVSHVTVCHPLQWRVNTTDALLYSCPVYDIALIHERDVLSNMRNMSARSSAA